MAQQYISAYNAITSPSGGVSVFKPSAEAATADALALSFWLRSNENVSLKLSEGTYRADDGTNASGTVNAEQGLGTVLTLDMGGAIQEAAALLPALESELEASLEELKSTVVAIAEQYNVIGVPSESAALWTEKYYAVKAVLDKEEYQISGIRFRVRTDYYGYISDHYKRDYLEDINGYITGEHYSQFCEYSDSEWEFFIEIAPSKDLMSFLNKIKIRFRVSQDNEVKDYDAKIASFIHLVEMNDISSPYEYGGLPDEYKYVYQTNRIDPGGIFTIKGPLERENCLTDPEAGTFSFRLNFAGPGMAQYEAYEKAFYWNAIIQANGGGAQSRFESYLRYAMNCTQEESTTLAAELPAFMLKTGAQKLTEAEMALPHIDLSANEARKVDVYIYLDGEAVTNADAITMDGVELSLNLQFEKIGGATNAMTAASEGGGQSADDDYLEGGNAYGLYLADNSLHLVYGMETYEMGQPFAGSTISAAIPFDPERAYADTPFGAAVSATSIVVESSFRRARPTSLAWWFFNFISVSSMTGLENINTSRVETMSGTFAQTGSWAPSFVVTGLSSWNTANVTDMSDMFNGAGFDASVFDIGDLSSWNTSNVVNMKAMFNYAGRGTTTFHIGDISSWDTSNVSDMTCMFADTGHAATYSLDLSSWTTKPGCEHGFFNDGVESKVIAPQWR